MLFQTVFYVLTFDSIYVVHSQILSKNQIVHVAKALFFKENQKIIPLLTKTELIVN